MIILWALWNAKNKIPFEAFIQISQELTSLAINRKGEYARAQHQVGLQISVKCKVDSATRERYKALVDGAFKRETAGIWVVIRDFEGDVIKAMAARVQGITEAAHMELMAIWRAMLYYLDLIHIHMHF